jgi:parallel beta-helix repeat protein
VQNNYIQVQAATQAHGMNITYGGTRGAAGENGAMKNNTIDGNTVRSRLRGIFLNDGFNYTISNNVVENSVGSGVTGFHHFAVYYNSTNGPATAYHNIYNNLIIQETANISAGTYGGTGLGLTSIGSGLGVQANVYNNMIIVRSVVAAANTAASVLRGIYCTSGITYNLYNNSVYIPNNANLTGLTAQAGCYGIGGWATTVASQVNMKNNIVTLKQQGAALATGPAAIYRTENASSTTVCDNNALYADSSANINTGYKGTTAPGTRYETLNDWQTGTGLDGASANLDASGVWVSGATDLHYNGDPGSTWKFGGDVSGAAGLDKDFDGADRDVIVPYVGADSPVAPDRTFTVASAYGSPSPAVGVNNTTSNTLVNASVGTPVVLAPGSRVVCTGYTGTGDAGSGSTNSTSFTLVNNSSITWNWQQQYQLTVNINPPGAGTVTPADGSWHDANASVPVQAFNNVGWAFDSWSGDLSGNTNPTNISMDTIKSVTANFVRTAYAQGPDFLIYSGPKADAYDQAEAVLGVNVSNTDVLDGIDGVITYGGFHPASEGGVANLTNGVFDATGVTVLGRDTDGTSDPSFTIEYDFITGGNVADVTGIRIFSGHADSGGSRAFINAKVEIDAGTGYYELGNLRTGSFGLAAPGGTDSAVAYAQWMGSVDNIQLIRFTFENVSHSSTNFFQAPDDNTTNPPLNYPNQATVVKEIDLFGTVELSVVNWDRY